MGSNLLCVAWLLAALAVAAVVPMVSAYQALWWVEVVSILSTPLTFAAAVSLVRWLVRWPVGDFFFAGAAMVAGVMASYPLDYSNFFSNGGREDVGMVYVLGAYLAGPLDLCLAAFGPRSRLVRLTLGTALLLCFGAWTASDGMDGAAHSRWAQCAAAVWFGFTAGAWVLDRVLRFTEPV